MTEGETEKLNELIAEPLLPPVHSCPKSEASTRYRLTCYMLIAVVVIVLFVMALSAYSIPIPEFVSAVVIYGFMKMLEGAYTSYFKSREDQAMKKLEAQNA
jgi:hypothetical protein